MLKQILVIGTVDQNNVGSLSANQSMAVIHSTVMRLGDVMSRTIKHLNPSDLEECWKV